MHTNTSSVWELEPLNLLREPEPVKPPKNGSQELVAGPFKRELEPVKNLQKRLPEPVLLKRELEQAPQHYLLPNILNTQYLMAI